MSGGALVTAAEIYLEHDRASFGNRMMWWPVVLGPLSAGAAWPGAPANAPRTPSCR
ncbi:hypothetical protein [Kitasatospora paranensis]|uniref:Uncharacterized protein n=1 Tax=Kitasatospora paranensis TaxID=258053 RepID=A0ABW2G5U6_9ACTN